MLYTLKWSQPRQITSLDAVIQGDGVGEPLCRYSSFDSWNSFKACPKNYAEDVDLSSVISYKPAGSSLILQGWSEDLEHAGRVF